MLEQYVVGVNQVVGLQGFLIIDLTAHRYLWFFLLVQDMLRRGLHLLFFVCNRGGRGGYGGGGDRRRDSHRDGGSGPDRNYHGGQRSRPYWRTSTANNLCTKLWSERTLSTLNPQSCMQTGDLGGLCAPGAWLFHFTFHLSTSSDGFDWLLEINLCYVNVFIEATG